MVRVAVVLRRYPFHESVETETLNDAGGRIVRLSMCREPQLQTRYRDSSLGENAPIPVHES